MKFDTPKFISNFVENQFPSFYKEEGENFVLFLKAYYEWLEDDWGVPDDGFGGPIRETRELQSYRDIDATIEKFLEFFQRKYLYGIPFNIIANKRFLLKHILDVYRSKGTIQSYRLLFKLLYNEDVQIYIPGRDIIKPSDGTWNEPKYIELSLNENIKNLIGKTITGVSSGVTAVAENFVKENYNNDEINILYISNLTPRNREFQIGERIVLLGEENDVEKVNQAPSVLGSLSSIEVINGGQGFNRGDVIKIAHRDPSNNSVVSYGIDGVLKVTDLSTGFGSLNFSIINGGFGYTGSANTFVYRNDSEGQGASFGIGVISSVEILQYNTDLLCDYHKLLLNAVAYGFPNDPTGNSASTFEDLLSFETDGFGSILTLDNIQTGNSYELSANVFVRSVQLSNILEGNVSYNTGSNTVIGTNTEFDIYFSNNDVISLQANTSLNSTLELAVIKEVVSNTELTLYGPPTLNSTASAVYRAAPTILPSQFAPYESEVFQQDGSIAGENEIITAQPNSGNNIVSKALAINSGKGYVEGETVKAYLYGAVSNNILIVEKGTGYTNNDLLIFAGGDPGVTANGYIVTNSNGEISNTVLVYAGSGYIETPTIRVRSNTGVGALLTTNLEEFNLTSEIIAKVNKTGVGKGRGYWSTTRGFLDSDKYIQDSFYYQDYSYEIKVARPLNKYKDIINKTFHVAGSELFGEYLKYVSGKSIISYAESSVTIE